MHDPDLNAPPFNPLPKVIIALAVLIGSVELMFQAAEAGYIGGPMGIGWRLAAFTRFGVIDGVFSWMWTNQTYPAGQVLRLLTYPFLHLGFAHALFVVVFILAIGKFVAEVFSPLSVLIIFFASAMIGALGYVIILDGTYALVGGYPAVYGLIGAFTWIKFRVLRAGGENAARAFQLIALFMAIQLLYKVLFGGTNEWLAELIGFGVGFGLSPLVGPGGTVRVRSWVERMRSR
jgi:membrane associated rhomboid family serine protease